MKKKPIGIMFVFMEEKDVGFHLRSVYEQFDGSLVLADRCNCFVHWDPAFRVERRIDCHIDQHKIEARQVGQWKEAA